jgi:hypothetical protein
MTAYRILFGTLAVFHVLGLFINVSYARTHAPSRRTALLPGWIIAALASLIVFTVPDGPLLRFWRAFLASAADDLQTLLIGIYVFSLLTCLAVFFFTDPLTRTGPRSFIAFTLRLAFGFGSEHETRALITAAEYAIVGVCGGALLLPAMVANGWLNEPPPKTLLAASWGTSICTMAIFRMIRRAAGDV